MNKYIIFAIIIVLAAGGLYLNYRSPQPSPSADEMGKLGEATLGEPAPGITGQPSRSTVSQPKTTPRPTPAANQGHVVFVVTDEAVPLDGIASIFLEVKETWIHGRGGWVQISKTPARYDLIRLRDSGFNELLSDINLEVGNYQQLRLVIQSVSILEKTGNVLNATLPSGEIKMPFNLRVLPQKDSAVIIDFIASDSLHRTGSGKYIFAPVVKVTAVSTGTTVQFFPNRVNVLTGSSDFAATYGMNENAEMKPDFKFTTLEVMDLMKNGALRIVPRDEKTSEYTVSAEAAMDMLLKDKTLDSVSSITSVMRKGARVWKIGGRKNNVLTLVYVDVTTGQVVGTE